MIGRWKSACLSFVALLTVAVPAAVPSAAQASTVSALGTSIYCRYYLATAYGPVAQCLKVHRTEETTRAWAGHYSPFTKQFSAFTGELKFVFDGQHWYGARVRATDGVVGETAGYGIVNSLYGPIIYAHQIRDSDAKLRWGNWNQATQLFYPSSGWMDFAGWPCPPIINPGAPCP